MVAARLGLDRPGVALEIVAAEVRNRLEADGDRCLIVFDNVADPDELRPYLPAAGHAQVVITSTDPSTAGLGRPLPVDVFTETESLDFLAERAGRDDADSADQQGPPTWRTNSATSRSRSPRRPPSSPPSTSPTRSTWTGCAPTRPPST